MVIMGLVRGLGQVSCVASLRRVATNLPTVGLSKLSCIFFFVPSRYVILSGLTDLPARSFEAKDRLNMLLGSMGDLWSE